MVVSMDNRDLKLEASMHLEMAVGLSNDLSAHLAKFERGEIDPIDILDGIAALVQMERRVWAALYMVQAMGGGSRPANFQKVIDDARWFDAHAEAKEAIETARRGE
jgi:hypothetical protein